MRTEQVVKCSARDSDKTDTVPACFEPAVIS